MLTFFAGGDNNLAVVMGGYKSPSAIRCDGRMNFPQNCVKVLDNMPATTNQEVFGFQSEPSSTVLIPAEIESGTPIQPAYLTFSTPYLSICIFPL